MDLYKSKVNSILIVQKLISSIIKIIIAQNRQIITLTHVQSLNKILSRDLQRQNLFRVLSKVPKVIDLSHAIANLIYNIIFPYHCKNCSVVFIQEVVLEEDLTISFRVNLNGDSKLERSSSCSKNPCLIINNLSILLAASKILIHWLAKRI